MQRFKKTSVLSLMLVAAVSTLLLFSSCDSSVTDPVQAVYYDLVINNHTAVVYDVYMKSSVGGNDYTQVGKLYASNHYHYHDLVIADTYSFRLVVTGGSVNNPAHEKSVNSSNSNTVTWNIN